MTYFAFKMENNKETEQEKVNKTILKQNDRVIAKIMAHKQKRHVKEPTEPIFKDILDGFSFDYGKIVVGPTAGEIMKMYKNDEF